LKSRQGHPWRLFFLRVNAAMGMFDSVVQDQGNVRASVSGIDCEKSGQRCGATSELRVGGLGLVDRDVVLALLERMQMMQSGIRTAPLANFPWLERFVRHAG
jgi:hypothetical protein